MMIAPIFARLSTRRQMMLRKSLVLVVSFTLRATPTAIAAGISEMESYSHHITFKPTAEQQQIPHVTYYGDVFCRAIGKTITRSRRVTILPYYPPTVPNHVRFRGKAGISQTFGNVRFDPKRTLSPRCRSASPTLLIVLRPGVT